MAHVVRFRNSLAKRLRWSRQGPAGKAPRENSRLKQRPQGSAHSTSTIISLSGTIVQTGERSEPQWKYFLRYPPPCAREQRTDENENNTIRGSRNIAASKKKKIQNNTMSNQQTRMTNFFLCGIINFTQMKSFTRKPSIGSTILKPVIISF